MPAMATSFKHLGTQGSTFTFGVDGVHTPNKPALLIQSSRIPDAFNANMEFTAKVVYGTVDAEGNVIASKTLCQVTTRYSKQGQESDLDAAIALIREYVAADEFTAHCKGQTPVQV